MRSSSLRPLSLESAKKSGWLGTVPNSATTEWLSSANRLSRAEIVVGMGSRLLPPPIKSSPSNEAKGSFGRNNGADWLISGDLNVDLRAERLGKAEETMQPCNHATM